MTTTFEMQRKLILLGGCPRAGKDTAADYLINELNAYAFKFSAPIKAAIRAAFELHPDEVNYAESIKGEPTALFHGHSYRATQISFSEDWAKPFFGQNIFGKLASRHLRNAIKLHPEYSLFVCSDSGFAAEAEPVIEVFGRKNVLLVRVYREGTSFAGDSRSHIELDGVTTVEIANNGSIDQYQTKIKDLAEWWLTQPS
jgi:hypothetical protein